MTELGDELDGVKTLHFAVDGAPDPSVGGSDSDEGVTFLHAVAEGTASASYGIEVARMAGLPESVVERSRDLVAGEPHTATAHEESGGQRDSPDEPPTSDEAAIRAALVADLQEIRVAEITPVEALVHLDRLKGRLDDGDN